MDEDTYSRHYSIERTTIVIIRIIINSELIFDNRYFGVKELRFGEVPDSIHLHGRHILWLKYKKIILNTL